MKKTYTAPEVEIILLECADIITTSLGNGLGNLVDGDNGEVTIPGPPPGVSPSPTSQQ